MILVLVLHLRQERRAWYLMFKGGAYGGLGDGCLRWLLFRGFRREDQVLEKDSGFVFWYELLMFRCSRTCQRPESMLLCRSGLFRPLRSPASEGTLVCSRVFSETEDLEEKYLVGVLLVIKKASAWFRCSERVGESLCRRRSCRFCS